MKYFFLLFLAFTAFSVKSQSKKIDSLETALKTATHDSIRDKIAEGFFYAGIDFLRVDELSSALKLFNKAIVIFKTTGNKEGLASVYNSLGQTYRDYGNSDKALEMFDLSLQFVKELKDKQGEITISGQKGMVYFTKGDIPQAIECLENSLIMAEANNLAGDVSDALSNLAVIYQNQKDYKKALEYYLRAEKMDIKSNDKEGIATVYNNIGAVYRDRIMPDSAMYYFVKALNIQKEINDLDGIGTSNNNIGIVHRLKGDYQKALEHFNIALRYAIKTEHTISVAHCFSNLGDIYMRLGNYTAAENNLKKGLTVADNTGYPLIIREINKQLYQLYKKLNKPAEALKHYEVFIVMKDSMYNEETRKSSIRSQFKYEYARKAAADSIKAADEKKITDARLAEGEARLKQERTQRLALYGGLGLVALFSGFMYNRFRVTRKQKHIIELKEKETQSQNVIITQQKHLVEEKHREITDSINYAERIQRSFLATNEFLDSNINSSFGVERNESKYFILFKPKDVVSGDFYWAENLSNGNFALVTADSTGHGVPGAIMSLLNITSLEKAIEHHTDPADILNATRNTIIGRLKKDGSAEGGKDGMDCSLLCFDFKQNIVKIAAAHNPVWIVRTDNGAKELIEIKGDKMPVGKHDKDQVPFTTHTFQLQEGDVIYTLTDGFPDQFGGENGKKFMSKKLKELLLANSQLKMDQQKEILESTFNNWVGKLEQVDDVTVIGIRV